MSDPAADLQKLLDDHRNLPGFVNYRKRTPDWEPSDEYIVADTRRRHLQAAVDELTRLRAENAEARKILEGILWQTGYTCVTAYEAAEDFLGVEWDGARQAFVRPDGTVVDGSES